MSVTGEVPDSALAAVTGLDGRTQVRSYRLPAVSADTGLLRVAASGVCGTDTAIVREGRLAGPTVLGHHVVGWMVAVGSQAARRWGVGVGDLVALQEYLPCHACRWCAQGEYRMCDRSDIRTGGRRFGTISVAEQPSLWGGNAEFLHLPAETLAHRLPPSMDPARAVWLLPLANAFDWTAEIGALPPGGTVVIIGPGQHGLACVVAARETGAGQVVIVGRTGDQDRLTLATKLGADHTVALNGRDDLNLVLNRLGNDRADLVINTSGAGPELTPALLALAGKRATVVEAGLARGHAPQLDMAALTSRAVALVGARGRSMTAIDRALSSLSSSDGAHPLDSVPSPAISLKGIDAILRPDLPHAQPPAIHPIVRP